MAYSDSTLGMRAIVSRLLPRKGDNRLAEMEVQPGLSRGNTVCTHPGERVVYLRIYEGGRTAVYEIRLEEWSRLNRDALKTP
jgi:hypothetical protein